MSDIVYEPLVAEGFEWINTLDDAHYETFLQFNGTPQGHNWKPVAVKRVRADEHACVPTDFPWLGGHALVMRRSAVDALRDMLLENGEILPLSTKDGVELFVFTCRVIDALNRPNSSLMLFPGTDRIMRIKKLALVGSAIVGADLFRLPHRASSTYVTSRFLQRYESAGLKCLTFNQVWAG